MDRTDLDGADVDGPVAGCTCEDCDDLRDEQDFVAWSAELAAPTADGA